MSPPTQTISDGDAELLLYRRLIEGDRTASADIAAAYLVPLVDWLCRTNPQVHPDDCAAAADEAIVNLIHHPSSFDPDQSGLYSFLQMAATRDLQNLLAKERRRNRGRRDLRIVELGEGAGKYSGAENDPSFRLRLAEVQCEQIPAGVRQGLNDVELQILELILARERRTTCFAEVMGISHLPPSDQRREVEKVKDRLKKRLDRAGRGTHESP